MKPTFRLGCTSDKIWDVAALVKFLACNQGNHIILQLDPEAVCLQTVGVYDILDSFTFSQVDIHTLNVLESHNKYNIHNPNKLAWWLERKENIDLQLHTWTKEKIFFALYGRPTAPRLGLAAYLYTQHRQSTWLHFSAVPDPDNLAQFELDKLLGYHIPSITAAGELISQLPLLLSSPDKYTSVNGYDFSDSLTRYYQDIFVDIVVESHVLGKTFFPTEKTIRPMWLKKPFIVFASQDYLLYMRQMGFKTFSDYWNEEYDGYEGPDRYIKMLQLIDDISNKSLNELTSMYQDMQHILDHNYNLLLTQTYTTQLNKVI